MCTASQSQQAHIPDGSPTPVEAIINAGKQLREQGRTADAISMYLRAVRLAQKLKDVRNETRALIRLSTVQLTVSQYKSAMDSLEKATVLADELKDAVLAGSARGDMAEIYAQMGDWESADSESYQSVAFLRKAPTKDERTGRFLSQALQNHADICFHLEKYPEGYRDSAEALAVARQISNKQRQAAVLDIRGAAFMRQGKIPEADESLNEALALSTELHDDEGLAFAKEHLAELELKRPAPDLQRGLRLVNEALNSSSLMFKSGRQYYPIHIRGKILELSGSNSGALSEYLKAVTVANQWRMGALPGDTTSTQTVATLEEVYADYCHLAAEMALRSNDNKLAASALQVLSENRAASLREQLQMVYGRSGRLPDEYFSLLSELQSAQAAVTLGKHTNEEQARLRQIRVRISDVENQIGIKPDKTHMFAEKIRRQNSLRDIQHTLGREQVLISISLGKAQSYLWAVTGGEVALSRLPGEAKLRNLAASYANAVRSGSNSAAPGSALSHALFAGMSPDVWERSEWMVVADGPLLSGVPFCALPNLAGTHVHRPLIEGKSVRFLPGELLLLDSPSHELKGNSSLRSFVGVGDPVYNMADPRWTRGRLLDAKMVGGGLKLARLVGSEREIRTAAQEWHDSGPVLLTGLSATREKLTAALAKPTDVVHFAVHVVSPRDEPQQAALALSLKDGAPELLTAEAVASLRVPGSLVVLSGCSSGQGKVLPGAGLVGLSRAWLVAGAAAVVVSSWPTEDDSGRFFSSFYSHLDETKSGNTGQRAALALHRTQLDMLSSKGYQASPAFWGAFAVISKE